MAFTAPPPHTCSMLPQAYDQHLNMILGEVEETLTTVEIDDETYEEIIKVGTQDRVKGPGGRGSHRDGSGGGGPTEATA